MSTIDEETSDRALPAQPDKEHQQPPRTLITFQISAPTPLLLFILLRSCPSLKHDVSTTAGAGLSERATLRAEVALAPCPYPSRAPQIVLASDIIHRHRRILGRCQRGRQYGDSATCSPQILECVHSAPCARTKLTNGLE